MMMEGYHSDNLGSQTSKMYCSMYANNKISIECGIISHTSIFMFYIYDSGSWIVIMTSGLIKRILGNMKVMH